MIEFRCRLSPAYRWSGIRCLLAFVLVATGSVPIFAATDGVVVGKFSQGLTQGWQAEVFSGETDYQIVVDKSSHPWKKVLRANTNDAASGLWFKQRIDLQQTPTLHWSWKTDHLYTGLDESKKQGDDFVARLYVVVSGGVLFWKTRALNYVWSSSFEIGDVWPNPFSSNALMFAVESGDKNLGQWQHYTRNVRDDLSKLFGEDVRYIDAVAVMTDSDNAGQRATTYYGDIYFTEE